MQNFKDSITGKIYSYEDDVTVTTSNGITTFSKDIFIRHHDAVIDTDGITVLQPAYDEINNVVFNTSSTLQPITQSEFDDLQAPPLSKVKIAQCDLIDAAYASAVGAPIAYLNTIFQADDDSCKVLNRVLTAAAGTLPAGFQWYDINNIGVDVTFVQLQGLAAEILMRGQPLFVHKQDKKAAINAATSTADVQAINW